MGAIRQRVAPFCQRGNTMYIANTTKQIQIPYFRVPEMKQPMHPVIPSGTQVEVGKTWNTFQVDSVIRQLEKFGARNAAEMKHATMLKYSGILYSIGKPISSDKIEDAHSVVVEEQAERSYKEMAKTALSIDAAQRDRSTRKRKAKSTTFEITEDLAPRTKPRGDEAKLSITVTPDGHDDPHI